MLKINFLYKLFKYKQNSSFNIVKYNLNEKLDLGNQINIQIIAIDKEISSNTAALFEAQIVKFRSTFSKTNNFIERIGKAAYKTKIEDSINWHQNKLKELYFRRRDLQIKLEKINGIFWLNRIKRLLLILLMLFFILISLFIFLSGFMIIIYLLPMIILIFLGYWIAKKTY